MFTVNPVNDAPSVSTFSFTRTVNEDDVVGFTNRNFVGNYTDIEGDPLVHIKIVAVPAHGTLKNGLT